MQFLHRTAGDPCKLGILPGAFNPVTIAHLALAHAALPVVDEVVFVLPRALPHKDYSGASLVERARILLTALSGEDRMSVGISSGGLFVDIAAECREAYGPDVRLSFLCGADAAERIASWDYGDPGAFDRMMGQFDLLVAERGGAFALPHRALQLDQDYTHVSATDVRERILRGEQWEHLVPPTAREHVRRIYAAGPGTTGRR